MSITVLPSRSRVARGVSIALLSAASAVTLLPSTTAAAVPPASAAIVSDSGCTTNSMGLNDDDSTAQIALPSTFEMYDGDVTSVSVSNNGTFRGDTGVARINPFSADLDSTETGTPVTYGETIYEGRPAFCVNWRDIGFFAYGTQYTSDFQALLVDRSNLQPGDFDAVFNYGRVAAPYGVGIGFSGNGGAFELPGSYQRGFFNDTNTETGLVHGSRGSDVLGRYVFRFRNGQLIDTAAPDTTVSTQPRALSNDSSPTLTYTSTSTGTDHERFECRVTAVAAEPDAFATCPDDGITYDDLEDGSYTFDVRAVDAFLDTDSTPASATFTIDTAAPDTRITAAPASTIGATSAAFAYASDDGGAVTYECRLATNGLAAAWGPCPVEGNTFTGLAEGGHQFDVRATDVAGNTDATPATHKFAVNVGRPTITATVDSEIPISAAGWYRNTVTISYTCAGNGSALTAPCPSPRVVPRVQMGRAFTATITTADGDTATVRTPLFIDKGKPRAAIKGFNTSRVHRSVPKARCKASDPRSGLDDCTIKITKVTRKNGDRFIIAKAKATDLAGNVRVVKKKARFSPR